MTTQFIRRDHDAAWVAAGAIGLSLLSFILYFRAGDTLLYGDAAAHINIARRVFDSRSPGLLQLGTVWLPLPHLLMMPFLVADSWWQSGLGGSIPSLIAFVLATVGIFRLVRDALTFRDEPDPAVRLAAWLAAIVFAANPNLVYLQSTAMTEAPYLALFVWALVYLGEFVREARRHEERLHLARPRSLLKCGLCLAGAELTRYDGWFAAAAVGVVALWVVASRWHNPELRRQFRNFVLLSAAAPAFWLAYNGVVYRNPLEFANGPYSARTIEQKTATPGFPPHPGSHNLSVAGLYFLKAAQLTMAEGNWQRAWVFVLVLGVILLLLFDRDLAPLLLLLIPLPFYMLSVAYGGVPIFVPVWWPFSHYNVRYGLQWLPAFAVFLALAVHFLGALLTDRKLQVAGVLAALLLAAGSYASVWRAQPVSLREARANSRTRIPFEAQLAARLRQLPPDATLLMYLGDHSGALEQARIPLRRVIQEGNHRVWKQPLDPDGLWERALADPASYADYVIAMEGDPVSRLARLDHLSVTGVVEVPGQPRATIYRTGLFGNHVR